MTGDLRALSEAATPGPWTVSKRGIEAGYDDVLCGGDVECMSYCYGGSSTIAGDRIDADLALIAAMRNALPDLLDAADRVAELERRIGKLADEWACDLPDHPVTVGTDPSHIRYCPGCHRAARLRALLDSLPADRLDGRGEGEG